MSDSELQNAGSASEDTFKRWVKEYRALEAEIKAATPTITQMRKRKKQLDEVILAWMQTNGVERVLLRDNEFLTRNIKTSSGPVNADHIGHVLQDYFGGDEKQASDLTARIYNSRSETESEVLKVLAEKKRKLRPVDLNNSS